MNQIEIDRLSNDESDAALTNELWKTAAKSLHMDESETQHHFPQW